MDESKELFLRRRKGVRLRPSFLTTMFDFERFEVYRKAEAFYSLILISVLKNKEIDKNLKDQLRRASLSIVLNIAEGAGKYARRDKKNFYAISRGSVNECVAILRILKIEGVVNEKIYVQAYDLLLEIAKMLSGLILRLEKQKAHPELAEGSSEMSRPGYL